MITFSAPGWKMLALAHNLAEKLGITPNLYAVPRSARVNLDQPATVWIDSLGNDQYRVELKGAGPADIERLRRAIRDLGLVIKP